METENLTTKKREHTQKKKKKNYNKNYKIIGNKYNQKLLQNNNFNLTSIQKKICINI